jgi:hypothetical protein
MFMPAGLREIRRFSLFPAASTGYGANEKLASKRHENGCHTREKPIPNASRVAVVAARFQPQSLPRRPHSRLPAQGKMTSSAVPRFPLLLLLLLGVAAMSSARAEEARKFGIYNPIHGYFTTPTSDRFAKLREDLAAGRRQLDASGELPLLRSLLKELEVPVSSQMLVYSVTSLQKRLISPRRPRALFFNDDTYVGFVPGGQMEVISTDPHLGEIYYIFDRFDGGAAVPRVVRSTECFNCHSPRYMENIPGLVVESVIPGITGGGERAFRRQQSGHGVPMEERFGGWHLTGVGEGWPRLWANLLIDYRDGHAIERPIALGELTNIRNYPRPTSDLLPQLLQEHQVGFVDRALQAAYRTRELLNEPGPGPELDRQVEELARPIVRYLLFADEVRLPAPVQGEADFKVAFLSNRRAASSGAALKDFDLKTRLFQYRCSYMIYTPTFSGLPAPLKSAVVRQLRAALAEKGGAAEYAYLPAAEKRVIRGILAETVAEFGRGN